MQIEIPILSASKSPDMVPDALLNACSSRLDAIRLCVQLSRLSNETICNQLGIDKGHFSRIMQGKAWFPDTKANHLMMLCGNYAPLQFEARTMGFQLFKDAKAQRKAELLDELQKLEVA